MAKKFKSGISLILAISIILSMVAFGGITAFAAEEGHVTNPSILTNQNFYYKTWNSYNWDEDHYNKIIIPEDGYITFTISKPLDNDNEICNYRLYLYNTENKEVWSCIRDSSVDVFNDYYNYKIGLHAGTYYLNVRPYFHIFSGDPSITAHYKYTFTAHDSFENGGNGSFETADTITRDKKMSAVMTEYPTEDDFFKVYLTKNKQYKIKVGNFKDDMWLKFYTADKKEVYPSHTDSGTTRVFAYTPTKTGWYYIEVSSSGLDIENPYSITVITPPELVKKNGKWYYYEGGKKSTFTGLFKHEGKWFYIQKGEWKTDTDLIKYKGEYFYIKGGKWTSSTATLFKKSGKYFAIKSGKWYKGKAIIKYSGKKFYCNKGFAQLKYSGKVVINGKTYKIKKGKVV